jgi:small subunit ribosomal protein S17
MAEGTTAPPRGNRKTEHGVVASAKSQKTITVVSERLVAHPIFKKYVRQHTVLKAHDEKGEAREGDLVEVMSTRPLSKTKRWRLVRIVRRAGLA